MTVTLDNSYVNPVLWELDPINSFKGSEQRWSLNLIETCSCMYTSREACNKEEYQYSFSETKL